MGRRSAASRGGLGHGSVLQVAIPEDRLNRGRSACHRAASHVMFFLSAKPTSPKGPNMNFQATITDRKTGETFAYTQDTLDELKAELKARKIECQKIAGSVSAKPHLKYLTLTTLEKEWLGMTVTTGFGRGEVFSIGPWPKTVWVILDEPNPLAAHYQHARSTDRMVCLRYDQCEKISSWRKRAEPIF